jgi:hypothetical protein
MRRRIAVVLVLACSLLAYAGTAGAASVLSTANITRDDNADNDVDIAVNPTN